MSNEAFQDGCASQTKGLGFLDNPYDSYSDEGRRWIDGYVKSMQISRAVPAAKCKHLRPFREYLCTYCGWSGRVAMPNDEPAHCSCGHALNICPAALEGDASASLGKVLYERMEHMDPSHEERTWEQLSDRERDLYITCAESVVVALGSSEIRTAPLRFRTHGANE